MNTYLLLRVFSCWPQFPTQALSQRFNCSFRGVVGRVTWRIGDALLGSSDHNCGRIQRRCRCFDGWQKGSNAIHYAKKIGIQNFVKVVGVCPRPLRSNPCVQSKEIDMSFVVVSTPADNSNIG